MIHHSAVAFYEAQAREFITEAKELLKLYTIKEKTSTKNVLRKNTIKP